MKYILMYLVAIVLANLSTSYFGGGASIVNAFLFIGLDLTARDKLHDAWNKNGIIWKMGLLILAGSLLSWVINRNAGMVAVASLVAFACAAIVDTIAYQLLHDRSYAVKVNGSNVFSAAVDSLVFPTIAFGGFLPLVTLGQFAAKVLGGLLWSYILRKRKKIEMTSDDIDSLEILVDYVLECFDGDDTDEQDYIYIHAKKLAAFVSRNVK